jgi:hypothetical protein
VRINGVDGLVMPFSRAARQCDSRLAFPAADLDNHPSTLVELSQLKKAVDLGWREHAG